MTVMGNAMIFISPHLRFRMGRYVECLSLCLMAEPFNAVSGSRICVIKGKPSDMEQPGIPCLQLCDIFLHFFISIDVTVIYNGIKPLQVSHVRIALQSCAAYPYCGEGIHRTGQKLYISAVGEQGCGLSCQRRICIDTKPCT